MGTATDGGNLQIGGPTGGSLGPDRLASSTSGWRKVINIRTSGRLPATFQQLLAEVLPGTSEEL